MYAKTRPTVTYPSKPWQQRQREQRRPAALPVGSYGGGRPPNPEPRARVYAAIVEYAATHSGHTPTRRELCQICDISSTSVTSYHVYALIDSGQLELIDGKLCVVGGVWLPPDGTVNT